MKALEFAPKDLALRLALVLEADGEDGLRTALAAMKYPAETVKRAALIKEVSAQEQQSINGMPNEAEKRDQAAEDINSIEYLLNKRDVEMNQEESQFGGAPSSSFGDEPENEPGMPDMPDLGNNNS